MTSLGPVSPGRLQLRGVSVFCYVPDDFIKTIAIEKIIQHDIIGLTKEMGMSIIQTK